MCMSRTIVYVPYWGIKGPVFGVASCNRHGHLITSKNYWDKHCTMCVGIPWNYILGNILVTMNSRTQNYLQPVSKPNCPTWCFHIGDHHKHCTVEVAYNWRSPESQDSPTCPWRAAKGPYTRFHMCLPSTKVHCWVRVLCKKGWCFPI